MCSWNKHLPPDRGRRLPCDVSGDGMHGSLRRRVAADIAKHRRREASEVGRLAGTASARA